MASFVELFTAKGVPEELANRASEILEREVATGKYDRTEEEKAIVNQAWRFYADHFRKEFTDRPQTLTQ